MHAQTYVHVEARMRAHTHIHAAGFTTRLGTSPQGTYPVNHSPATRNASQFQQETTSPDTLGQTVQAQDQIVESRECHNLCSLQTSEEEEERRIKGE